MSIVSLPEDRDIWVFAYGSLIWNPCFEYDEKVPAYLRGYHRKLCVISHNYRGTPKKPGLVFGLDTGGSCYGLAFRIGQTQVRDAVKFIRDRELTSSIYNEKFVALSLEDGRKVHALAYIVNHQHPKYISNLDVEEVFNLVKDAAGTLGSNLEYVISTFRGISSLGLRDKNLKWLSERLLMQPQSSA
ncbi:gamma-glutamylcyclotransferase [Microvirga sp. 2MCAF35]|uniref:gamma-glutamylcyclotransferase n=1 Tax=Microvirga sp. 2MCAF35 TaxID=3232987 RepID=UPI003F94ACB7